MPIEEAARASGIPMQEIVERAKEAMRNGEATAWQLKIIAQRSIQKGMETLESITNEGCRTGNGLYNTDLDAAIALTKLGIETMKLYMKYPVIKENAKTGEAIRDLFDMMNPWKLKDPKDSG